MFVITEDERLILGMFTPSEKEIIKITGGDENMKRFIERLKGLKYNSGKMEKYHGEVEAQRVGEAIGLEKGRQKGREEGRQEGREAEKIETAKTMLKDGMAPEVVQKYTKLSISKIMTLL